MRNVLKIPQQRQPLHRVQPKRENIFKPKRVRDDMLYAVLKSEKIRPPIEAPSKPENDYSVQVRTNDGWVEGTFYNPNEKYPLPKLNNPHDSAIFLGIPYAKPPGNHNIILKTTVGVGLFCEISFLLFCNRLVILYNFRAKKNKPTQL